MSQLFPVVAEHSRYVQRVRRRYAAELVLLPPGLPDRVVIGALIDTLAENRPLASALRMARHLVLERLAVLDIEQGASVADVTLAMTHLAEVTLDLALADARRELDAIHGEPRTADGADIAFWVLGMICKTVWVVYPKGPDASPSDTEVRTAMRGWGYVDNKTSAVSDALTATRYVQTQPPARKRVRNR